MTANSNSVRLKVTQTRGQPITEHAHFAMVEMSALEGMAGLIATAPRAAQLLVTLIRRMSPGAAGAVVVSRQTMCELLGASMPTTERALRALVEGGWVQRIKIGGANALAINSRVAWVGPRGQLQHAVFEATVIASRAEQDALALEPPPLRTVPMMRMGEDVLPVGPGEQPPSQPGLTGIPPATAVVGADQVDRHELEARGQQRLVE